jgi:resolvase-like protein
MAKTKRAALYLRVSTDGQTTDNQRLALEAVATQRGWSVVATYEDAGISGAKGRDKRPGLDKLLQDAARARFDVVMAWALDKARAFTGGPDRHSAVVGGRAYATASTLGWAGQGTCTGRSAWRGRSRRPSRSV